MRHNQIRLAHAEPKQKPGTKRPAGDASAALEEVHGITSVKWICRHAIGGSEIKAYIPGTDSLDIIAFARQAEHIDAEANAELIVRAVNSYGRCQPIMAQMIDALELCLKSKGLTWDVEQEMDIVLRRAKAMCGY